MANIIKRNPTTGQLVANGEKLENLIRQCSGESICVEDYLVSNISEQKREVIQKEYRVFSEANYTKQITARLINPTSFTILDPEIIVFRFKRGHLEDIARAAHLGNLKEGIIHMYKDAYFLCIKADFIPEVLHEYGSEDDISVGWLTEHSMKMCTVEDLLSAFC